MANPINEETLKLIEVSWSSPAASPNLHKGEIPYSSVGTLRKKEAIA